MIFAMQDISPRHYVRKEVMASEDDEAIFTNNYGYNVKLDHAYSLMVHISPSLSVIMKCVCDNETCLLL